MAGAQLLMDAGRGDFKCLDQEENLLNEYLQVGGCRGALQCILYHCVVFVCISTAASLPAHCTLAHNSPSDSVSLQPLTARPRVWFGTQVQACKFQVHDVSCRVCVGDIANTTQYNV